MPYIATVDAIWAKLPVGLRPAFAFAFQFAPEHRLPIAPTIIATYPTLAVRWPSTQLITIEHGFTTVNNVAQKWFSGSLNEEAFNGVLKDYGITVQEFKQLNILSSFTDLIARLPELTFAEVRKAIRILEKYSKPSTNSDSRRPRLFDKLCSLIPACSPEDIETLRNFDSNALSDLLPALQKSIAGWLELSAATGSPSSYKKMLELAVDEPKSWWSKPLIQFLNALTSPPTNSQAVAIWRLVFPSEVLTSFIELKLLGAEANELILISAIPANLNSSQVAPVLKLAKDAEWMRLHAMCLVRTLKAPEAIASHVDAITTSTLGLDVLRKEYGIGALLTFAGQKENEIFDTYIGRVLRDDTATLPLPDSAPCARWLRLLSCAVKFGGPLLGRFRGLVEAALSSKDDDSKGMEQLFDACRQHDFGIILAIEQPMQVIEAFSREKRSEFVLSFNNFVVGEIIDGGDLRVSDTFRDFLDASRVLHALKDVQASDAARIGVNAFKCLRFLGDVDCSEWLIDMFTRTSNRSIDSNIADQITALLLNRDFPASAAIIQDTAEKYWRKDVAPIWSGIRYKYEIVKDRAVSKKLATERLPKVLIVTALPLERSEVMKYLPGHQYRPDLYADLARWPVNQPQFEVYVLTTGQGNLASQGATQTFIGKLKPKFAFFVGVGGGVKDSDIGDVVYSTKVYFVEGGKEEADGFKARPSNEYTSEPLVQLAHRIGETKWQPLNTSRDSKSPRATPAVLGSGEKVLADTSNEAKNFQNMKTHYNDTQVVDMEAFGFLRTLRNCDVRLGMVIRGVSDKIEKKEETDAKGNQPLAAQNAAAFLFALLGGCSVLLPPKKRKKPTVKSILVSLFSDSNTLP